MDELLTQVGVGGILAILILREVLPLIKNGKNNSTIGRNEFNTNKSEVRYRDMCDEIHRGINRQFADLKADLNEIKSMIQNNGPPPPRVRT